MQIVYKSEVLDTANIGQTKELRYNHNRFNLNQPRFFTHEGKCLTNVNKRRKQKANKVMQKQQDQQSLKKGFYLGRLFYAQLLVDTRPYNTKEGTQYMLPKGTEVLIEVTKGGFRSYYLRGFKWYSLTAVKENLNSFRLERSEFKMLNKPVVFTQKGKGSGFTMKSQLTEKSHVPAITFATQAKYAGGLTK